ncbi:efflux RND transporter permease subunit, partial [Bacteroidota bacterium]
MNITELAVKRPSLFIVVFSILALLGTISYLSLNYEFLPKINAPIIAITTIYPGAAPSEVENSVTKKLEQQVSGIQDVDQITSTSYEGVSSIVVQLKYGADLDQSVQSAQRKVNSIFSQLPKGVMQPNVDKVALDEMPIMKLGATSDLTPTEFADVITNKIAPALTRLDGVARVDVEGDRKREIKVNVNASKLASYNLSILQLTQAIATANLDFPTGRIKDDNSQLQVRLSGKMKSLDDLRNLIITTTQGGNPIYLSDVAEVVDGTADIKFITRLNGINSVALNIVKQSDGNAVEVSKLVQTEINNLSHEYSDINLQFKIGSDSSVFTLEAANGVMEDLLLAIVLVAFIMLFFLHSPKNASIVMVSIPLSIVSTFIAMDVLGYSLNLMSLLGLSLVVGILVDDSIVVLENIFTHLEKGQSPKESAISTGKEIGLSVASITLVIVVVFLPILFVQGIVADLLRQFSVVIVVATLISLAVSFTITTFLASRFTKLVHIDPSKKRNLPLIWFDSGIEQFDRTYRNLLDWSLKHKRLLMAGVFVLIIASLSLMKMGLIGSEFVSVGDTGEFVIEVELPKDATIEQTNLLSMKVENIVKQHPEVENIFTTVGASSGAMGNQSQANAMQVSVKMVPLDKRKISSVDFSVQLKRELFMALPGVDIKTFIESASGGTSAPIQVIVECSDLDTLFVWSEKIRDLVKTVPGTSQVGLSAESGNPELSVSIDRRRLADLRLSMDMVGATLQNSFTGNTDSKFIEGANEYNINVRLDQFDRSNPDDLYNIGFINNRGELILLSQFATVTRTFGPTKLERTNKISSSTVGAYVVGRAVGTVGTEVDAKIKELKLPRGVDIKMGGDLENQQKSFSSLGMALLISLILVYLIMVALYDNWVHPFVVMFAVPVAIIGAFLALALTLNNMSIFAMLGLIMLVGLVIKNSILIVDNINHLRSKGTELIEAIKEGTMERFRPILMTTIAMIFAMLPIALAKGAGAEWKNGLSWVLIGGLTSSMILTMLVVPSMYLVVEN